MATAHTDATHGMTLAAVSLPYYRHIMNDGLHKFVRFAKNVWNISSEGKTDRQIATEGLHAFEEWMKEIGLVMHSAELGVTEELLPRIADSTFLLTSGYRSLTREEVIEILRESM